MAKLAVALTFFAALLAAPGIAGGVTAKSGLFGVVKRGPIAPVCRVDVPCDAPTKVTLVFSRRGGKVTRVRSAPNGRYRLALAPGYYDIRTVEKIGIGSLPRPHAVHVRAGHWDRIDLFIDTGIR